MEFLGEDPDVGFTQGVLMTAGQNMALHPSLSQFRPPGFVIGETYMKLLALKKRNVSLIRPGLVRLPGLFMSLPD